MIRTLADICDKLAEGTYYNEEHVRVCVILRVLSKLGWDIWNPNEVNTEYKVVRTEDMTRVDVALFCNIYAPSVYIEVKAVGKMHGDLPRVEQQLRDYNRNNTAAFSVITDGQRWRFYYSQTGGEFKDKCFKDIDLLENEIDGSAIVLESSLSKAEILNGNATKGANNYLLLGQRQRAMEDGLLKARRVSQEPPFPRLPDALIQVVSQSGIFISEQEAMTFITITNDRRPPDLSPITLPEPVIELTTGSRRRRLGRTGNELPPTGTKCRFRYGDQVYEGEIQGREMVVTEFGKFSALSSASSQITETSRNGWRDWEFQLPGSNEWILAQLWRESKQ